MEYIQNFEGETFWKWTTWKIQVRE